MGEINLIPYVLKDKKNKRLLINKIITYVVIVIAILFMGIYIPNYTLNDLQLKENQIKSKVNENNSVITQQQKLTQEISNYQLYTDKVNNLTKQKNSISVSDRIRGFEKYIPTNLVISTLVYTKDSIVITGSTNVYNSISEFVANLELSDNYKNARIISITSGQTQNGTNISYNFSIAIN